MELGQKLSNKAHGKKTKKLNYLICTQYVFSNPVGLSPLFPIVSCSCQSVAATPLIIKQRKKIGIDLKEFHSTCSGLIESYSSDVT